MRKFMSTTKLLLLCFIMYMLMVLPVFADGFYHKQQAMQYAGQYPLNYPGKAQGSMYRAPYPAAVPVYQVVEVYPNGHVQTAPVRHVNEYTQQRNVQVGRAQTAPLRRLNEYSPSRQNQVYYRKSPQNVYIAPPKRRQAPYQGGQNVMIPGERPRLQFNALDGPTQMYTNGKPVLDPALVYLPPLYPEKPKRRAIQRKHDKNQNVQTRNQNKEKIPAAPVTRPNTGHTPRAMEKKEVKSATTSTLTPMPSPILTNSPSAGISRPTSGEAPKSMLSPTQPKPATSAPSGSAPTAAPYEGSAPPVGSSNATGN